MGDVKTSIQIDSALKLEVEREMLGKEKYFSDVVEQALRLWLERVRDGKGTPEGSDVVSPSGASHEVSINCSRKNVPDHHKLERILTRGGKGRSLGIRSNLDAFIGDMRREEIEVPKLSPAKRAG